MNIVEDIDSYVNKILGLKFEDKGELRSEDARPGDSDRKSEVPEGFFGYGLCAIEGSDYVLLKQNVPNVKLATLIKNCLEAEKAIGIPCILVKENMDGSERRQLIQHKVCFVVPGRQIYIPHLGTYFTERRLNAFREVEQLTPAAQYLLLYHLEKKPFDRTSLGEIAKILGYSAKTITIVAAELKRAGLCDILPSGRKTKFLVFKKTGRALWDLAWPMLGSPVGKVGYVDETDVDRSRLALVPDEGETYCYAVWKRTETGNDLFFKASEIEFVGCARIEFWKYDPCKLATGGRVDPLSFALCLKADADGAVQKQIERLVTETLG